MNGGVHFEKGKTGRGSEDRIQSMVPGLGSGRGGEDYKMPAISKGDCSCEESES